MFDVDAMILAPMMGAGVFGQNIQPLYIPADGTPAFNIDGVFDDQYVGLNIEAQEPGYATFAPVLGVRAAQFPPGFTPVQNDTVRVWSPRGLTPDPIARTPSTDFVVSTVRPDGKGWIKLELKTSGQ